MHALPGTHLCNQRNAMLSMAFGVGVGGEIISSEACVCQVGGSSLVRSQNE